MRTHPLSDTWLTDPLEWDNGSEWIDVPFLEGTPVRIQTRKVVQWDDKPRKGFKVWIGANAESHSAVLVVGEGKARKMFCSDHDDVCACKVVALHYMEADNAR